MPPRRITPIRIIVPILAILALAGLIFLGIRTSKEAPPKVGEETPAPKEWPTQEIRKETIADNTKGYAISAVYPVTASEETNRLFAEFVTSKIKAFKEDTKAEDMPEEFGPLTLDITYREELWDNADNYIFTIYTDTGGAHGFEATVTFCFDVWGQRITLENLFTDSVRGLPMVAAAVQKELAERPFANQEWIRDGAAPTAENYRNFVITDRGVTFMFDPYQVAPYAAGMQEVEVPLSAFQSVANKTLFE